MNILVKMSWVKESAKAGMSGLTSRQAARHALTNPTLHLDDPLFKEMDVSGLFYKFN